MFDMYYFLSISIPKVLRIPVESVQQQSATGRAVLPAASPADSLARRAVGAWAACPARPAGRSGPSAASGAASASAPAASSRPEGAQCRPASACVGSRSTPRPRTT